MVVDAAQETLRLLSIGAGTGALDVGDGVIYLSRGRVTFAECPRTPDLETRLVQSGSISEGRWRALVERSSADGGGLRAVIRQVRVPADLLPVMRSTVLDAASALVPGSGAVTCRYHPGRRHWAGDLVQWDVDDLLASLPAGPDDQVGNDDVPVLRPVERQAVVLLEARDWPMLGHVDGRTSVAALAWRHGLPLAGARAAVRRLLGSGTLRLLGTPRASPPDPSQAPGWTEASGKTGPAPGEEAGPRLTPEELTPRGRSSQGGEGGGRTVREGLPRRERRAQGEYREQGPAPTPAPARPGQFAPPRDPVLLQRVLDGLRRMS